MNLNKLNYYNIWKVVVTMAATAFSFLYPLAMVFKWHTYFDSPYYWIIHVVFILDFFISLHQHKTMENDEVFGTTYSLKKYTKTWMIPDILCMIPLCIFVPIPSLEMIKFVKLIKVGKFMQNLRQHEIQFNNTLILIYSIFWFLNAIHNLSCIWLALFGIDPELDQVSNYINSIYWTSTTLTTVGYGDIVPHSNAQKIFTMFMQLLGVGFYGVVIGNIASILGKKDPAQSAYKDSIERLTALIKIRDIPVNLQKQLRDYFTYKWKNRHGYDESEFLMELPTSLGRQVAIHLKKNYLKDIEIFRNIDDDFLQEMALSFRSVVYTPGDVIFEEGDEGDCMFFVIKGVLQVVTKDGNIIAKIKEGDLFGEIALFMSSKRTAAVIAETYCDLYKLDQPAFNRVLKKFPGIASKIESIVQQRTNELL